MHKVASHHKPVLPCHTLERNFRNSACFLDSCGGTKWTVRESLTTQQIQQHTAKTVAATLRTEVIKLSDTPHLHYFYTLLQIMFNTHKTIKTTECYKSAMIRVRRWSEKTQTRRHWHSGMHLCPRTGVLPQSKHWFALRSQPQTVDCRCGQRGPAMPGWCWETHRSLHTHQALKGTLSTVWKKENTQ